jgi:hypothetical protein
MRNKIFLLALVVVMTGTSGCCRSCRNFFRRGAPCGTAALALPMMGAPRPLGRAFVTAPQPTQAAPQMIMPQFVRPQPDCRCQQAQPQCCDPCNNQSGFGGGFDCGCNSGCMPCAPGGYGGGMGRTNGGEVVNQGEFFGGYIEGSAPEGSGTSEIYPSDPGPVDGN